jgi:hypothetical protein
MKGGFAPSSSKGDFPDRPAFLTFGATSQSIRLRARTEHWYSREQRLDAD